MAKRSLRIGLSACMMATDPSRRIFNGRPLLYAEESLARYLQSLGATVYMLPTVPSPGPSLDEVCGWLDGLVLQGGVDVSPLSYGETPLKDEWQGDRRRDEYEISLIRTFHRQRKPILGICRGLQILNVSFGGTLYQDISTFRPEALIHRDADIYEKNSHRIDILSGQSLSELYLGQTTGLVNSVHHQAIKDLAEDFVITARSSDDGIIEAIEKRRQSPDDPLCFAVQWHPEFQDPADTSMLDPKVILRHFMNAMESSISRNDHS
ncbi:gamma-glutamyl-gamma-aminobutyrate hydrolase family protein [Oligoflexus tunisiensis]|uniref:gamma-glutamyl-gamma-aminobutyrate hydrolase family protein n=1 Tax=Oligoflexus tunisiensis TaxID=708132 RepID=UPI000AD690EF|nr:type 1 glutamine amidotransferase [Oligoflexus tunisiensis]